MYATVQILSGCARMMQNTLNACSRSPSRSRIPGFRRRKKMSAEWVFSSAALPHDGEPVEFVLDGREVAMDGTYARQTFQSRWSGYDVQRVRTWRPADMESSGQSPHP
jgi:hypothetical protein